MSATEAFPLIGLFGVLGLIGLFSVAGLVMLASYYPRHFNMIISILKVVFAGRGGYSDKDR